AAVADDDYPPIHREHLQICSQVHVGQHLQNDIDATSASSFHDLVGITSLRLIESLMRPFALDEIQPLVSARGAKNSEPLGARNLYRRRAHAATCPVHQ